MMGGAITTISAMQNQNASLFAPDRDTHLSTFQRRDVQGSILESEEELYYSEVLGFYLRTTILQIKKGRTWEAAKLFECDDAQSRVFNEFRSDKTVNSQSKKYRTLETFRPMTSEQVARKIVENEMPEQEGLRAAVLATLQE